MTQKIMANVRAAEEERKGLFRRLFHPLSVKLPIQAIAVLFLAVTAYYIYQNMHPTAKYTEAPTEKFEAAKPALPGLSPHLSRRYAVSLLREPRAAPDAGI